MERRKVFTGLGFILLIFVAVWVAVIIRWRLSNRVPNSVDILLYLLALPVLLVLIFWGVNRGVAAFKTHQEKKAARADATDADAQEDPVTDPTLAFQLPVVALDTLLPTGNAAAVMEAALAGERVAIHPSLKGSHQQPVFAADIASLDTEGLAASLPEATKRWSKARLRTMLLAEQLAGRQLDEWFDAVTTANTNPPDDEQQQPSPLVVNWMLAGEWEEEDQKIAADWLSQRLAEQGWQAPLLQVRPQAASPQQLLTFIDQLNLAYHQKQLQHPHLVMATYSAIDPATIASRSSASLYGANNAEGDIFGEAAASLLVVPPDSELTRLPATFGRLFSGKRAKPVDAPQKLQSTLLEALAAQAKSAAELAATLAAGADTDPTADGEADAKTPAPEELLLVSDTDMRASRMAEAMNLSCQLAPDTPVKKALLPLGAANGCAGAALTLATLAVALHACVEEEKPVVVVSHLHDSYRSLLRVEPVLAAEPTDDAATA